MGNIRRKRWLRRHPEEEVVAVEEPVVEEVIEEKPEPIKEKDVVLESEIVQTEDPEVVLVNDEPMVKTTVKKGRPKKVQKDI